MTTTIALTLFFIVLLLAVSAFFSGSETALTALSRARIHQLSRKGSSRAAMIEVLISSKEKFLGAILLGNNLVNILASALATSVFLHFFGSKGVLIATVVMTALVVVFAEVLPKTYAISNPDRMALGVAPVLRLVVAVFAPVTVAVEWLVRLTLKLLGAGKDTSVLSAQDELRGAIALHHKEGGVIRRDRDMLGGILDLQELEVSDIMIHRTKMKMIDAHTPVDSIISKVVKSGITRLPVWKDEPDNIIGILHAKDLFQAMNDAGNDPQKIRLEDLYTPPWFVPETTSVRDQLNAFLRRKTHFAIVVDEYGEVQGLITLEDILEEIVGEIADEHDTVINGVRPQPDGSVNVDGSIPVRDLNRAMDWQLPDDQATTVAGLVIHEAQTIPEAGQTFTYYGYRFHVLKRKRNRITSLRITPLGS